jgi:hypothetical protein
MGESLLVCTRCGAATHLLAVITDTQQVSRILRHLRETPGLDPATVN